MSYYDKVCGSLIGGAAGDALGYAVEFLKESEIKARYGASGISSYEYKGGIARISDDTQMTLFTAQGLLRSPGTDISSYIDSIRRMYICWFRTQTEPFSFENTGAETYLMGIPALYEQRAPGGTCLSSLADGGLGTLEHRINDSKGCGGVMRVAPIGLFAGLELDDDDAAMLGASAAAITHTHELGYIPAAAMVHIIRRLMRDDAGDGGAVPGADPGAGADGPGEPASVLPVREAVVEAVAACERLFEGAKHLDEFVTLMNEAVELAADKSVSDIDAIHRLGEGWVAEETLAIACYCAMRYEADRDFDSALRASVNHKGDSDSTGAVTGNIMGAFVGFESIPDKYKDGLEMYGLLLQTADELCGEDDEGEDI